MDYTDLSLHNLVPIDAHVSLEFTGTTVRNKDFFTVKAESDQQNRWFFAFKVEGGEARITFDNKTDPLPDGTKGHLLSPGIPYTLSRSEFRQMRIVPAAGATVRLVGQTYTRESLK